MKKVLIVCNNMEVGGVQKALLSLLKNISHLYDTSILIFNDEGNYMNQIPKNVRILPTNRYLRLLGMNQRKAKSKSLFDSLLRGILVIYSKIFNHKLPRNLVFLSYPNLKEFDIAISFTQDISDKSFAVGCNDFVIKKAGNSKKITFVHSDFSMYGGNTKKIQKKYEKFDYIACVSNSCKEIFVSIMPSLKEKTKVVYNFHDCLEIMNQANNKPILYNRDFFNIITIARLSEEKGILRALESIKEVYTKEPKIKWHLIGDGDLNEKIQDYIKEHNMQEIILMHGNQNNPYMYLRNADLFFLPSIHEAAPLVFGEAQVLGIPILTTETLSAKELVEKTQTGIVCENSLEGLIDSLSYTLKNKASLKKMKKIEVNENNKIALEQFCYLMDIEVRKL